MGITHKKEFGIYHWDTFDNETFLMGEENTLEKAERFVKKEYGARINSKGADRVDIVDSKGNVIKHYSVC